MSTEGELQVMEQEPRQECAIRCRSSIPPPFALSQKAKEKTLILCGRSLPDLGERVAQFLDLGLSPFSVRTFANGELLPQVEESVRGKHVYLIQSVCPPDVNGYLMELLLSVAMLREASAKTVTAIIPHYGYARQDRKSHPRVPISAALVALFLQTAGVNRVVSFDLHCGQIQGFFPPVIPCDNIPAARIAVDYFAPLLAKHSHVSVAVVSPDAGGTARAKAFMDMLAKIPSEAESKRPIHFAMINKERKEAGVVDSMTLVGDVKGHMCIIVDDMIDTAGTLCKAAETLVNQEGAVEVYAFATHGVFSGPAIGRIESSVLKEVVVCDTIPPPSEVSESTKITYLSVDRLMSCVISAIINCRSVAAMLE